MTQRNQTLSVIAAALLAIAGPHQVQADPVTGSIGFTGSFTDSATFNGSALPTLYGANYITSITATVPTSGNGAPTGSYAPTAGDTATFQTPISLATGLPVSSVTGAPLPVPTELWSVEAGSDTFAFFVNSVTENTGVLPPIPNFGSYIDTISGTGYVEEIGPSGVIGGPTTGTWSIQLAESTSGGAGTASFEFGATAQTSGPVPDGGLTISLLGGSLLAIAALRRRWSL
jgi:hypothetical protein